MIISYEDVGDLPKVRLAGRWAQNVAIRLGTVRRGLAGTGKKPMASPGFDAGNRCSKSMNELASSSL